MRQPQRLPTARDLMTTSLLTFRPEQPLLEALTALLRHGVSGAPVVGESGRLVGILSELDCLRMLASDEFYQGDPEMGARVEQFMTRGGRTVPPTLGIYALAYYFLTTPIRRLPVVEDGCLLGQVSRRDVLRGMEAMSLGRSSRKRYPDYVQPA